MICGVANFNNPPSLAILTTFIVIVNVLKRNFSQADLDAAMDVDEDCGGGGGGDGGGRSSYELLCDDGFVYDQGGNSIA